MDKTHEEDLLPLLLFPLFSLLLSSSLWPTAREKPPEMAAMEDSILRDGEGGAKGEKGAGEVAAMGGRGVAAWVEKGREEEVWARVKGRRGRLGPWAFGVPPPLLAHFMASHKASLAWAEGPSSQLPMKSLNLF